MDQNIDLQLPPDDFPQLGDDLWLPEKWYLEPSIIDENPMVSPMMVASAAATVTQVPTPAPAPTARLADPEMVTWTNHKSIPVTRVPNAYAEGVKFDIYYPGKDHPIIGVSTMYSLIKPKPYGGELRTHIWVRWRACGSLDVQPTCLHLFRVKNTCDPGQPRIRVRILGRTGSWVTCSAEYVPEKELRPARKKRKGGEGDGGGEDMHINGGDVERPQPLAPIAPPTHRVRIRLLCDETIHDMFRGTGL